MSSFIQPVRPIDTAPPWNWNPGQTFVTAFNESRLAKQKADEMRLSNELETILLPYKQKQAALALDKMQLDMELQSARIDREREATKQAYRQEIDRMKGISDSGESRFSPHIYLGNKTQTATGTAATTGAATTRRVLGKGTITPKTP